jgi:hypothetical protein
MRACNFVWMKGCCYDINIKWWCGKSVMMLTGLSSVAEGGEESVSSLVLHCVVFLKFFFYFF